LNAVVIEADAATGKATDIERQSYSLDELLMLASLAMADLFDLPFEEPPPSAPVRPSGAC
jgi:hypothetical protein